MCTPKTEGQAKEPRDPRDSGPVTRAWRFGWRNTKLAGKGLFVIGCAGLLWVVAGADM